MWFFALFREIHGVFFSITLKRTIEINLQIEEFSCGQGGITARCVKVRLYGVHGFCFMTCFQKMMVQCLGVCDMRGTVRDPAFREGADERIFAYKHRRARAVPSPNGFGRNTLCT